MVSADPADDCTFGVTIPDEDRYNRVEDQFEVEKRLFGVINKTVNGSGLEILRSSMQAQFRKQAPGEQATDFIVPEGMFDQIRNQRNNVAYAMTGPSGGLYDKLTSNTYWESKAYPRGGGLPDDDPLVRDRYTGSYFAMNASVVAGVSNKDYRTSMLNTIIFNLNSDNWYNWVFADHFHELGLYYDYRDWSLSDKSGSNHPCLSQIGRDHFKGAKSIKDVYKGLGGSFWDNLVDQTMTRPKALQDLAQLELMPFAPDKDLLDQLPTRTSARLRNWVNAGRPLENSALMGRAGAKPIMEREEDDDDMEGGGDDAMDVDQQIATTSATDSDRGMRKRKQRRTRTGAAARGAVRRPARRAAPARPRRFRNSRTGADAEDDDDDEKDDDDGSASSSSSESSADESAGDDMNDDDNNAAPTESDEEDEDEDEDAPAPSRKSTPRTPLSEIRATLKRNNMEDTEVMEIFMHYLQAIDNDRKKGYLAQLKSLLAKHGRGWPMPALHAWAAMAPLILQDDLDDSLETLSKKTNRERFPLTKLEQTAWRTNQGSFSSNGDQDALDTLARANANSFRWIPEGDASNPGTISLYSDPYLEVAVPLTHSASALTLASTHLVLFAMTPEALDSMVEKTGRMNIDYQGIDKNSEASFVQGADRISALQYSTTLSAVFAAVQKFGRDMTENEDAAQAQLLIDLTALCHVHPVRGTKKQYLAAVTQGFINDLPVLELQTVLSAPILATKKLLDHCYASDSNPSAKEDVTVSLARSVVNHINDINLGLKDNLRAQRSDYITHEERTSKSSKTGGGARLGSLERALPETVRRELWASGGKNNPRTVHVAPERFERWVAAMQDAEHVVQGYKEAICVKLQTSIEDQTLSGQSEEAANARIATLQGRTSFNELEDLYFALYIHLRLTQGHWGPSGVRGDEWESAFKQMVELVDLVYSQPPVGNIDPRRVASILLHAYVYNTPTKAKWTADKALLAKISTSVGDVLSDLALTAGTTYESALQVMNDDADELAKGYLEDIISNVPHVGRPTQGANAADSPWHLRKPDASAPQISKALSLLEAGAGKDDITSVSSAGWTAETLLIYIVQWLRKNSEGPITRPIVQKQLQKFKAQKQVTLEADDSDWVYKGVADIWDHLRSHGTTWLDTVVTVDDFVDGRGELGDTVDVPRPARGGGVAMQRHDNAMLTVDELAALDQKELRRRVEEFYDHYPVEDGRIWKVMLSNDILPAVMYVNFRPAIHWRTGAVLGFKRGKVGNMFVNRPDMLIGEDPMKYATHPIHTLSIITALLCIY